MSTVTLRWTQPLSACLALLTLSLALAYREAGAQAPILPFVPATTPDAAKRLIEAVNAQLPYVPGEVLVKFKDGTAAVARGRALSVMRGGANATESEWVGDVFIARTPDEPNPVAAATALARQPEVDWAQPNYLRALHAVPNDPSYPRQWNLDLIGMPRAWDISPGGNASVVIAVIDTGVTTLTGSYPFTLWTESGFRDVEVPVAVNPDIAVSRILPGRDFILWTGPVLDLVGHGTHLAGSALQETNNTFGLAGIAYQARLMPLKACFGYWDLQILQASAGIPGYVDPRQSTGCPDSTVSAAIRYAADNGAHVINLSLGGPDPSPITRDAVRYAVSRGAFVAISNGNQFQRGNPVEYPAAYAPEVSGAVSVGAVGRLGRRAYYSSTGPHLELVAPGGDILEGGVAGQVFQIGLLTEDFDPFSVIRPRFNRYVESPLQGTSVATPHVAGLAALLHAQGIKAPGAIETAMRRLARDLGVPGRDDEYGDGLIDARRTLLGLGLVR